MKVRHIFTLALLVACQSYARPPERSEPARGIPVVVQNNDPIPVEATILNFPEASSELREQMSVRLLSHTSDPYSSTVYETAYTVPEGKTLIIKDLWGTNSIEDTTPHRMLLILGKLNPFSDTNACDISSEPTHYLGVPAEGTSALNFGAGPEYLGPSEVCFAVLGETGDFLLGGFSGYLVDSP
jgi:hypothetical protein